MSSMAECLEELGVKESMLSDEELDSLDQNGFLILPVRLTPPLSTRCGLASTISWPPKATKPGSRSARRRLGPAGQPGREGLAVRPLLDVPPQLAAVAHVFAGHDFKLHSVNGRSAHPGHGLQALHTDWHEPVDPGDYQVCNSIWMLDAFTEENGATRVVPGSHRWGRVPKEAMADPPTTIPTKCCCLARRVRARYSILTFGTAGRPITRTGRAAPCTALSSAGSINSKPCSGST